MTLSDQRQSPSRIESVTSSCSSLASFGDLPATRSRQETIAPSLIKVPNAQRVIWQRLVKPVRTA